MLSRIMWVSVAGLALIAGMAFQNDWAFDWSDDARISERTQRTIEAKVDRAVDASFDKMVVVKSENGDVEVPAEVKRAMAEAIGELVKAETDLAMAKIGEDDEKAVAAATVRRDRARTAVDRMKDEIERLEQGTQVDKDALREQIRREVQEDVRATVREAVKS